MRPRPFQRHDVETEYSVFTVKAQVITGDWEGDPDVPRGVNYLPPYVDDLEVLVGDTDVTEMLNGATLDEIQAEILRGDI